MTAVTDAAPQPIPSTGDPTADAELAALRRQTTSIWDHQEQVDNLSKARMRTVLALRRRGVLFRVIAEAVPTTEQTIYKIHREARREEEHERGTHRYCTAKTCPVMAEREAQEAEQS